jgi:hypothetical protein
MYDDYIVTEKKTQQRRSAFMDSVQQKRVKATNAARFQSGESEVAALAIAAKAHVDNNFSSVGPFSSGYKFESY